MMQGFGVHTFRLVTAEGASSLVKFHWKPKLGTHSLVWDEAMKIAGADSDFHRRDLWEAIESGEYPEWELGLQLFTEAEAEAFSFDVLDATKVIPEELVPVPAALARVLESPSKPEVTVSPALSLTALPGDGGIRTRKVALLAAHGVDGTSLLAARAALHKAGAVTAVIAARLGAIDTSDDVAVEATGSFENSPPVLFDAVVLPDGEEGIKSLLGNAQAVEFAALQYRHGKTLLALGASRALLDRAGVQPQLASGDADPGVVVAKGTKGSESDKAHGAFIAAIAKHRHPTRETDPPKV